MITRLRPELSIEAHESAVFNIGGEVYIVTIRRGVAEVIRDHEPVYGTPVPIGEVGSLPTKEVLTWLDECSPGWMMAGHASRQAPSPLIPTPLGGLCSSWTPLPKPFCGVTPE